MRFAKRPSAQFANSTNKILQTRMTFKHWSCYSPTSSQVRVLVEQASTAAYFTRFAIKKNSYESLNARKQIKLLPQATYEDNFSTFPQPRFFFWFTSSGFLKRPVLLQYWLLHPFFHEEATCESSTIKGLLYAAKAVPSKDYFTHLTLKNTRKGCWVISPNCRASHPWRFCAVGDAVARRYDVLRDWLWDACHMAGVRWGSRCKGFHSEEGLHYCLEQSTRKLS